MDQNWDEHNKEIDMINDSKRLTTSEILTRNFTRDTHLKRKEKKF